MGPKNPPLPSTVKKVGKKSSSSFDSKKVGQKNPPLPSTERGWVKNNPSSPLTRTGVGQVTGDRPTCSTVSTWQLTYVRHIPTDITRASLYIYIYIYTAHSLSLPLSLSLYIYIDRQTYCSLSSLSLFLCLSICLCLPVCLLVCLSISACLPVCLPACLPACLSVCISLSCPPPPPPSLSLNFYCREDFENKKLNRSGRLKSGCSPLAAGIACRLSREHRYYHWVLNTEGP